MLQVDQLNACRSGELRVKPDHFNAVLDNIGYSVSGTVLPHTKLKITNIVVSFRDFVVDRFAWKQRPTQVLFHDVAMEKHFATGRASSGWNPDHNVSALNPGSYSAYVKASSGLNPLVVALALRVAEFLLRVVFYTPRRLVSLLGIFFAALDAGKNTLLSGRYLSTDSRTIDRAVERVSTEFISVGPQLTLSAREFVAAGLANEGSRGDSDAPTVMFVVASLGAKFVVASALRSTERLSAMFAVFHDKALRCFVRNYQYHDNFAHAMGDC